MRESPAWRALSFAARKIIDRLELEHATAAKKMAGCQSPTRTSRTLASGATASPARSVRSWHWASQRWRERDMAAPLK